MLRFCKNSTQNLNIRIICKGKKTVLIVKTNGRQHSDSIVVTFSCCKLKSWTIRCCIASPMLPVARYRYVDILKSGKPTPPRNTLCTVITSISFIIPDATTSALYIGLLETSPIKKHFQNKSFSYDSNCTVLDEKLLFGKWLLPAVNTGTSYYPIPFRRACSWYAVAVRDTPISRACSRYLLCLLLFQSEFWPRSHHRQPKLNFCDV